MGTVEATRSRSGSATEFRELLDETLFELDVDEKAGPLLRATGMRVRFDFPDLGMVLNVAASEAPDHHLRWEFSDAVDWEPKLSFSMDSQIANAYLQGKESLAIAIARGRVRYEPSGDSGRITPDRCPVGGGRRRGPLGTIARCSRSHATRTTR